VTGVLYCADVGNYGHEELDVISKGGNYGYPYLEGTYSGEKANQMPEGFSSIPPILEYPRGFGSFEGNCIIGGRVYRGALFPELVGLYLFADHITGNIWTISYDGQKAAGWKVLANDAGIAAFGTDPRNGELLMADVIESKIKRLVTQP